MIIGNRIPSLITKAYIDDFRVYERPLTAYETKKLFEICHSYCYDCFGPFVDSCYLCKP